MTQNRVQKSIQSLIEQFGVACGAEKNSLNTELGNSISQSVTSYAQNPDKGIILL